MDKEDYQLEGYESREDYLFCLSEDYGIDLEIVESLADVLGPEEDFDGLVSVLGDINGM